MTKTPLSFIALFKTNFVVNEAVAVVSHPVNISVFTGTKVYKVPKQQARRFPKDEERTIAIVEPLELPEGHYLEIKIYTQIQDAEKASAFCEAEIDRALAMLVSIYNIHLLDMLVYRGWLVEKSYGVLGGWTQSVDEPKFNLDAKETERTLTRMREHLRTHEDRFDRFTLMSRFLSKALSYPNEEEKFLLLWTALEVFPMKNTSNIEPISTYLGEILKQDADTLKEKLAIGKLYGMRSALVHNGKFSVEVIDSVAVDHNHEERRDEYAESDTFARLEYILREIMRYMCGLPYSGSLDRYL